MDPIHPVYQLFFAAANGDIKSINSLLTTEFYFQHELIPAIVIATERAHIHCMCLLVSYCRYRYNCLPSGLEPEINWALDKGSSINPLLGPIWYALIGDE